MNINLDLLRKTLRDLEQEEKLNRADRSFLIRLLRELLEATEKPDLFEGDLPAVLQVQVSNPHENQRMTKLDTQLIQEERLRGADRAIAEVASLHDVLAGVLERLFEQTPGIYDAYIFLYESGRLTFGAGRASTQENDLTWRSPRPRGLTYTVARLGQPMIIPDMSTHPLFVEEKWSGSIVGIPLKVGPRVVGVLTVARKPAKEFTPEDLHNIQAFADQSATEIENARIDSLAKEQIRIDASTGLHNRRALDERLDAEVLNAALGQFPFAFFMLQLEGYEEINQRYGHSAGDFILAETATAISKDLRKSDFLARYDASRWGLVLSRTDRATALSIAERIEDIISRRRFSLPEKGSRKVTITIGIANFPEDGLTPSDLIQASERALADASQDPGSIHFASEPEQDGTQHPAP